MLDDEHAMTPLRVVVVWVTQRSMRAHDTCARSMRVVVVWYQIQEEYELLFGQYEAVKSQVRRRAFHASVHGTNTATERRHPHSHTPTRGQVRYNSSCLYRASTHMTSQR